MENIDLQAFMLYWFMIWAVLGSAISPLIFDRNHRSPWLGALLGLMIGIVSGQVFGWLILSNLIAINASLATWGSMLGGLVLLIPFWMLISPSKDSSLEHTGFVAGTISPLAFYLLMLSVLPLAWAILLAFFDYSPRRMGGSFLGLGGENPFVGLQYFQTMFTGEGRDGLIFQNSFRNTFVFTLMVVPLNLMITLPLAAMIESVHAFFKTVFRAIYFLPVVTSSVGVAVMWGYIFNTQYGLLNDVLTSAGIGAINWLYDPLATVMGLPAAMVAVVIAYLWQDFGYNLVIFIAALQNVSEDFKEAARVDGANSFQVFWHITLPLLRPTILATSILTMISSFQVFDLIQVMTQGGPSRIGITRVLVLDIYENAFRYEKMGWAASMSVAMFIVVGLLTILQTRLLRSDWEY